MRNPSQMPLSSVSLSKEVVHWLDLYFTDILKRHATSGDLYGMLREAYVLGAFHTGTVAGALEA